MKNLTFMIWMASWPTICLLYTCIAERVLHREYSSNVLVCGAVAEIITYLVVAKLLYAGN